MVSPSFLLFFKHKKDGILCRLYKKIIFYIQKKLFLHWKSDRFVILCTETFK